MILGDKNGVCKLCLSSDNPLCKSHIVPEFCYEYEAKGHRRHAFAISLLDDGLKKRIVQKGHREYLLCPKCESRFCHYERIFAEYWRSKTQLEGPLNHGQCIIIDGLEYLATKLFIMSVFWRCSISEIFGMNIQLGPYSEKIRKILYAGQFVPQEHYPIFCSIILDPNGFPWTGYVDNPDRLRVESSTSYRMAFGGCMWTLMISDHWIPKKLESMKHALSESGEFLLFAQNYQSFKSIRKIARELQKSENINS